MTSEECRTEHPAVSLPLPFCDQMVAVLLRQCHRRSCRRRLADIWSCGALCYYRKLSALTNTSCASVSVWFQNLFCKLIVWKLGIYTYFKLFKSTFVSGGCVVWWVHWQRWKCWCWNMGGCSPHISNASSNALTMFTGMHWTLWRIVPSDVEKHDTTFVPSCTFLDI